MSTQLKDIWKIKGIIDESKTYEHWHVELSDNEEPKKQTSSSHSNTSDLDDDEDGSCNSSDSEVCGTIASNKFAMLDVSD